MRRLRRQGICRHQGAACLEDESHIFASERGMRRDDIRQGLRITGFERRLTVAFTVDDDRVTILRLCHGGQDWEKGF